MGIDTPSVQFLCCAKKLGVDFSETMMVGRQSLNIPPDITASILDTIGIPREQTTALLEGQKFAEPLFAILGARQVSSIDVSDYERPTQTHDFNQALPARLVNQFSVVYDGGTIEHVFNIPQAFKNCMEMVRVGGHFIQVNVANNSMGHGFWQLSPELICRVFSRENGFLVKVVLLHESARHKYSPVNFGKWYKVDDPAAHHRRVELTNHRPTYICTIAQRVAEERIFARFPQQSDYVEVWNRTPQSIHSPPQSVHARSVRSSIPRMLPHPLRRFAGSWLDAVERTRSAFEYPYYHRVSDDDLVHGRI
jgi:hypothetical protein